jgi:hypothetical protein
VTGSFPKCTPLPSQWRKQRISHPAKLTLVLWTLPGYIRKVSTIITYLLMMHS